ncbi:hypothetical protein HY639_01660 [Candidatus Woesearchaeota archaeon]|nr:hypothetical protein [Candidatus Woesearchaeota archaeon]
MRSIFNHDLSEKLMGSVHEALLEHGMASYGVQKKGKTVTITVRNSKSSLELLLTEGMVTMHGSFPSLEKNVMRLLQKNEYYGKNGVYKQWPLLSQQEKEDYFPLLTKEEFRLKYPKSGRQLTSEGDACGFVYLRPEVPDYYNTRWSDIIAYDCPHCKGVVLGVPQYKGQKDVHAHSRWRSYYQCSRCNGEIIDW